MTRDWLAGFFVLAMRQVVPAGVGWLNPGQRTRPWRFQCEPLQR